MTYSIKDTKKKVPFTENVKNTGRGAKLFIRNLIAGAEAAAWVIAEAVLVTVVYNVFKGNVALNDIALYGIAFAALMVGGRLGWEFVMYLNKQGQSYEN